MRICLYFQDGLVDMKHFLGFLEECLLVLVHKKLTQSDCMGHSAHHKVMMEVFLREFYLYITHLI